MLQFAVDLALALGFAVAPKYLKRDVDMFATL
jgi:hypothetical protein